MKGQFFYLVRIQYLGFRFHGWAKQPQIKTVHNMVDRTLSFILGKNKFKTMGGSRTDAKVSAQEYTFELFLEEPLNKENFLSLFNLNLPADIKALSVDEVDEHFNIIQSPKIKEYIYLFAFGEKAHPFSAPFITTVQEELDIDLMKKGAELFVGLHDFTAYCKDPKPSTKTKRAVLYSSIGVNEEWKANFFPETSFAYTVGAKGFLRNQIRLMMGQLFLLGKGQTTLDEIANSLQSESTVSLFNLAPASGLILNKVEYS